MRVSRSDVSCFCLDPARQLASPAQTRCRRRSAGSGPALARLRTNASRVGAATGVDERRRFQIVAGAIVGLERDLARAVRRSRSGASDRCQLDAASSRSAGRIVTCISFSASANVAGDTGGPVTGPVPNVGGAPGWKVSRRRRRRWSGRRWCLASARAGGGQHAEGSCEQKLSACVHDASPGYITAAMNTRILRKLEGLRHRRAPERRGTRGHAGWDRSLADQLEEFRQPLAGDSPRWSTAPAQSRVAGTLPARVSRVASPHNRARLRPPFLRRIPAVLQLWSESRMLQFLEPMG